MKSLMLLAASSLMLLSGCAMEATEALDYAPDTAEGASAVLQEHAEAQGPASPSSAIRTLPRKRFFWCPTAVDDHRACNEVTFTSSNGTSPLEPDPVPWLEDCIEISAAEADACDPHVVVVLLSPSP